MPLDLLPLKINIANELIQEINKFAIFPKDSISFSDFKKNLSNDLLNLNNVEAIYKFVYAKKELGASIQELVVSRNISLHILKILDFQNKILKKLKSLLKIEINN